MKNHNAVVWTGSWNYTVNGTYRNNNNALVLQSEEAVAAYQAEFDEMFLRGECGITSTEGAVEFTEAGIPIKILFASEDDVVGSIVSEIEAAETSIHFMAFSFTQDDIGLALRSAVSLNCAVVRHSSVRCRLCSVLG